MDLTGTYECVWADGVLRQIHKDGIDRTNDPEIRRLMLGDRSYAAELAAKLIPPRLWKRTP